MSRIDEIKARRAAMFVTPLEYLPLAILGDLDFLLAEVEGHLSALANERERCAKIADAVAERETDEGLVGGITTNGVTAQEIAASIRLSKT